MTTPRNAPPIGEKPQLTPCEFQVCCELVNTVLLHKQIAAKLGKSVKTVEVQIASAYKKLGVTSRCELIQRFHSQREVPVKSTSQGLLHGLMQRLDEMEQTLNHLLGERRHAAGVAHKIKCIDSIGQPFGRHYSADGGEENSPAARTRV